MSWVEPIYNRTQMDVANRTDKGMVQAHDFNRIEGNLEVLHHKTGVPFSSRVWDKDGYPFEADYKRYLTTLQALREHVQPASLPDVPDMPVNTWKKWNDLELIIFEVNRIQGAYEANAIHAGELYSGDSIGVI